MEAIKRFWLVGVFSVLLFLIWTIKYSLWLGVGGGLNIGFLLGIFIDACIRDIENGATKESFKYAVFVFIFFPGIGAFYGMFLVEYGAVYGALIGAWVYFFLINKLKKNDNPK